MNNSHNWNKLEKVADARTPAGERQRLLEEIESSPELLAQWKAFRILQTWPDVDSVNSKECSQDQVVSRIREENSIDTGIRRMFPYVATAALAASIVIAFINVGRNDDSSDISLDDVFGLPEPTIENAILANL